MGSPWCYGEAPGVVGKPLMLCGVPGVMRESRCYGEAPDAMGCYDRVPGVPLALWGNPWCP